MNVDIAKALGELNEDAVLEGVKKLYAGGTPPLEILGQLQKGMELVGRQYEAGEYFLSELIMSADIFKGAAGIIGSAFKEDKSKIVGTVVIGTVKEDIHDIGKNIVITILSCNGFNVIDLGVDVAQEKFVEAIRDHQPQVVGMSCLLTTAFDNMRDAIAAIEAAGLRNSCKVLVGGGPVDEKVCRYVQADGYCRNAQEAVDACRKILGVN